MKHLKKYSEEIAERLKNVKGVNKVRTLVDPYSLFFSFKINDLSVLNDIDRAIPMHYYMSIKDNKVIIQYVIIQEFSEFLANHYLMNKN